MGVNQIYPDWDQLVQLGLEFPRIYLCLKGVNDIAGETIKGISVVIGSDTTGLTSALADVNKASRGIQSELKQVERLLRLDPSNVELVAQQQQLLTDAVANTSEKLNRLRAAQEQVNEQFARGEISAGQYRAFQREIAATEQQLSRFEGRLSGASDGLDDLGNSAESNADRLNKAGEKIKGVGEKMAIGISAPIAAAGGIMLKGAVDAENAQSKLQASLGITTDEAEKLGVVAEEVWKKGFGESIEEVNENIATVRKNIAGLTDNELRGITEGAMTIADVFGAEVSDSTKTAGTMMKNFGISAQDSLDLITVGFQKGGDYSGELLDTLNEYAPQFASLGISADQAMGILIAGAGAGAFSLDKVGDSMKEFNLRAQDGSDATAEGFAAIGLNADKMGASIAKGGEDAQKAFTATVTALASMKDPMAQNAAGTALFGTQWEDVRAKVIIAMSDGMKGIGEFKGATDEAATAMYENNPGLALTKAMRELQSAIGPALLPLASIINDTIVPAVKSMADGFNELSPTGQKVVLAVVGIVAAIGPLLIIIGGLTSALGTLATIAGVVGTAIGALSLPIVAAIAAITALIAAGVLLYRNWDEVKAFAIRLKDGLISAFSAMLNGVSAIIVKVKDAIINGIQIALDWIINLPGKMTTYGSDIMQGLINGIKSMAGKVSRAVGDIVDGIKSKIKSALKINSPSKVMEELGKNIGQGLAIGIEKEIGSIADATQNMVNAVTDVNVGLPSITGSSKLGSSIAASSTPEITFINRGTIVGTNGMKEFARIVSGQIAGTYGLGTGGDF